MSARPSGGEAATSEWVWVKLDARAAAKGGIPAQIPVPRREIRDVEKKGFPRERVAAWLAEFLRRFPRSPQAADAQRALDKARLWDEAAAHLKEGRFEQARPALERILAIDPQDASAHFNLAAVHRNAENPEQALEHYARAQAVFDDEGVFFTNRGRTHQLLGRKKEAVADFRRALELMPGDDFALRRLAQLGELVEVYGNADDPARTMPGRRAPTCAPKNRTRRPFWPLLTDTPWRSTRISRWKRPAWPPNSASKIPAHGCTWASRSGSSAALRMRWNR
jgi:tetratricopeptide (TPR) repeat protein